MVQQKRKKVIVSGASRGIGASTMKLLAGSGYEVIGTARSEEQLQSLSEELRAKGSAASYFTVDMSDPDSVDELIETSARTIVPSIISS